MRLDEQHLTTSVDQHTHIQQVPIHVVNILGMMETIINKNFPCSQEFRTQRKRKTKI